MKTLTTLGAWIAGLFLGFDQFAARNWKRICLVAALIVAVFTLRACYEAGKYQQAVHDNPPLSAREARAIKKENTVLHRQAARIEHQKDSVVARVQLSDQRIQATEHQVDSLTHQYEKVPAAIAHATDDELFRQLATYHPGAFPDTASPGH